MVIMADVKVLRKLMVSWSGSSCQRLLTSRWEDLCVGSEETSSTQIVLYLLQMILA
jgi:hypothetical protein